MKYEYQINWANARNTNLDDCTGRSVRNAWIGLLSTLTLLPPEWMANLEVRTLYDRKNWTTLTSCTILAVCYALLLSVSFKPIFVDFASIFNMLALSAVLILFIVCVCVCRLLFVCVFVCFQLSSDLLYQVTVPGAVLLSQKTWHKTRQLAFDSA